MSNLSSSGKTFVRNLHLSGVVGLRSTKRYPYGLYTASPYSLINQVARVKICSLSLGFLKRTKQWLFKLKFRFPLPWWNRFCTMMTSIPRILWRHCVPVSPPQNCPFITTVNYSHLYQNTPWISFWVFSAAFVVVLLSKVSWMWFIGCLVNTSSYLCDDVVFCHALPNLVYCTVHRRKRGRNPHKIVFFSLWATLLL